MPSSKLMSFLSLALALAPLASTHFIVNTPAPLGSNIDNEDTVPCGGFTPSTSEVTTNFHVGGDAIGVSTLHAQSSFAYRAMLGQSLSAPNWTVLIPTIQQYGLNNFCEPSIAVPASWVGQAGLMQIIQDAEDGVHYQCMAVNFVAGVGTPSSSTCSNSSGVSATFMADPVLDSAEGQSVTSSAASTSSSASSTVASGTSSTAQPSPTPSKSAALPTKKMEALSGGLILVGLVAGLVSI